MTNANRVPIHQQLPNHTMKDNDTYLYAGLAQVDAQTVRVPAVVLHQLLQGAEGGAPRNKEPALVQLADAVVLHRVPIADREGEVIPPRLRVPGTKGAVNRRLPNGQKTANRRSPNGQHTVNIRPTYGQQTDNIRTTYGQHTDNIRTTYGQHTVN